MEYSSESVRSHLNTLLLGNRIALHQQVGSTNDLAREAGRNGEPEGLVILAEEQVRGRGRLGRSWIAPPGSSILCSVLLRPRFPTEYAFYLTIATSLAIWRGIRVLGSGITNPSPLIPSIKWPNDVLLNGRKVSGILCESEFAGGEWAFAIIGFGINANLDTDQLGELRHAATSLSTELGRDIDRAAFLARVLGELEGLYLAMQNGQFRTVFNEWAGALETVGKRVSVRDTSHVVSGLAMRIDSDGALVIRTDGGVEERVLAGELIS
jgi:BirA family transcriptional regulator, biotin operon repressor / biotin---[acetyl-CoA-carboxylase] ligase